MYCPRCGEQQVSGNLRFCSKCGLPLTVVSEVLSNGGTLPQLEELYSGKKPWLTRKNGIFFSIIWFILFVPFGASFWGVLGVDELAGVSAVFGVFSALVMFLFSLFFLRSGPTETANMYPIQNQQSLPQNLNVNQAAQGELPAAQGQTAQEYVNPAAGSWKAPDTGDLVPPSVTEGTTKLLKKEKLEEN
ncbi:MAG: hypothetical protein HKN25_05080 [Pyrinomonadaceae bacterium]|nr:hypothetical protein [Pyrinomonadaceae bacterium]